MQRKVLIMTLILGLIAAGFTAWGLVNGDIMVQMAATAIRWVAIGGLVWMSIKKNKLTTWIFFSMVAGLEFGYDFPWIATELNVVSKIFIKLIKTIIGPLLFCTLVVGIAGHGDIKQLGRMGWKSLVYFELVTTVALFIGLLVVNITRPGDGINPALWANTESIEKVEAQGWKDIVLHIFPENIAKSVADGQVLQIVIFSLIFGVALLFIKERPKKVMMEFCESLTEVMFSFTNIVMKLAPLAIGCALAASIGKMGFGILVNMIKMVGSLYLALGLLIVVVFIPVAKMINLPIRRFVKAIAEPVTLAFATTSSESALPKAMDALEKFGIPRKIVTFVLPTGYSFNLDGTTLYLALATVFCAQATGIELSIQQQLVIVFTLMLTSKGVAGVPRASLIILIATLSSFGIPIEPAYVILGIDEIMDMGRTATNVTGNCLASAVVTKWEGEDTWNNELAGNS